MITVTNNDIVSMAIKTKHDTYHYQLSEEWIKGEFLSVSPYRYIDFVIYMDL